VRKRRKILICDNVDMHPRDKRWVAGSLVALLFRRCNRPARLAEPNNDFRFFPSSATAPGTAMPEILRAHLARD